MKDIEIEVIPKLPEQPVGWLEVTLPKFVMKKLQSYIETAKKDPTNWNGHLAGNISESLLMQDEDDWFFQTILLPISKKFIECYPTYVKEQTGIFERDEAIKLCLDSIWVNFQKQNEFNPLHYHDGLLSFVIWVKIPTDWREQHTLPFLVNTDTAIASDFGFAYTTMLGQLKHITYCLDKKSEGTMLMFPSKMMHSVYPFYNCDEERISISGNIKLDVK
jgi:hypothetical protein